MPSPAFRLHARMMMTMMTTMMMMMTTMMMMTIVSLTMRLQDSK
jgi:hypothetical protein